MTSVEDVIEKMEKLRMAGCVCHKCSDGYEFDWEVCMLTAPMHLHNHSAYLYKNNIGKPICMECNCWDYYAGHLIDCECNCHAHEDDPDFIDPWARR